VHNLEQLARRVQHDARADGESDEACPAESARSTTGFGGMPQRFERRTHRGDHGAFVVARALALTTKLHLPLIV
jgi:hypothetical protein